MCPDTPLAVYRSGDKTVDYVVLFCPVFFRFTSSTEGTGSVVQMSKIDSKTCRPSIAVGRVTWERPGSFSQKPRSRIESGQ